VINLTPTKSLLNDNPAVDPINVESRARRFWAALIFGILGTQVLAGMVAVYLATTDQSHVIIPEYDQHAMNWDAHVAERLASDRLGWNLKFSVSPSADIFKQRDIAIKLTDREQLPICDATVALTAFHHARGGDRMTVTLQSDENGEYHAKLPMPRSGAWQFEISASRQADHFSKTLQLEIDFQNQPKVPMLKR
jgi:nitrogen fixation protein FixH